MPPLGLRFRAGGQIADIEIPDSPPVGGPPTVAGFSPSQGPVGTSIAIYGSFPEAVSEIRVGGTICSVFLKQSNTLCTASVPVGSIGGVVRVTTASGFSTSADAFTIGAAPTFEGLVELPGARMAAMRAISDPVPNFAAISRRVTAASGAGSAVQSAINTAAALTGGPRLVIVPDGGSNRLQLVLPANADAQYPIYIAPASVANGTVTLVRGRRMKQSSSRAWMPLWETVNYGPTQQDTVVVAGWNSGAHNFHVYGVEIRVWSGADGANGFCPQLLDDGGYGTDGYGPPAPGISGFPTITTGQAPDGLYFSHCVLGGRAFDAAGNWRQFNLGRTLYANAGRNAIYDSDEIEHGAQGGAGADRGIWGGIFCLGPSLMYNVGTDFGGGILFMHGGQDVPNAWPNHADHEIAYCHFVRAGKYVYGHPDHVFGTNGIGCLWGFKNMGEIKTSKRSWFHHNVFDGHVWDGQSAALIFKGVNQDGRGRDDTTEDVAFTDNVIRSRYYGTIGMSMREVIALADGDLDTVTRDAVWAVAAKYASTAPRPAATSEELGTASAMLVQYSATENGSYSYTHVPGVSQWVRYRYVAGTSFAGMRRTAIRRNVCITNCESPVKLDGVSGSARTFSNTFRSTGGWYVSPGRTSATTTLNGRDVQWNQNLVISCDRALSDTDEAWFRMVFPIHGTADLGGNVNATETLYQLTSQDSAGGSLFTPDSFDLPDNTPDQSSLSTFWSDGVLVTASGGAPGGWTDFGARTSFRSAGSVAAVSGTGLNRTVAWVSGRPSGPGGPAGPPDLAGLMANLALVTSGNLN